MSKAVLISIQPKWVEKIASGEKTIEVRKTKPKLETPFKVYIYCTKEKYKVDALHIFPNGRIEGWQLETANIFGEYGNETVIGEFVCDKIFPIQIFLKGNIEDYNYYKMEKSCVPYDDIVNYIGNGKKGYGWNISNLKIYDKPKELSEFYQECKGVCVSTAKKILCLKTKTLKLGGCDRKIPLRRPPQSWCYVEVQE